MGAEIGDTQRLTQGLRRWVMGYLILFVVISLAAIVLTWAILG